MEYLLKLYLYITPPLVVIGLVALVCWNSWQDRRAARELAEKDRP